jgi:hypothetical protein
MEGDGVADEIRARVLGVQEKCGRHNKKSAAGAAPRELLLDAGWKCKRRRLLEELRRSVIFL